VGFGLSSFRMVGMGTGFKQLDVVDTLDRFQRASRRALLLDWGGTLTPVDAGLYDQRDMTDGQVEKAAALAVSSPCRPCPCLPWPRLPPLLPPRFSQPHVASTPPPLLLLSPLLSPNPGIPLSPPHFPPLLPPLPAQVVPDRVLRVLSSLCADPKNEVMIVSGLSKDKVCVWGEVVGMGCKDSLVWDWARGGREGGVNCLEMASQPFPPARPHFMEVCGGGLTGGAAQS
jgi:hypothetical protein